MEFSKNKNVELTIIDMTKEGLGISKVDSYVFFVKNAVIGDKVKAVITKVTSSIIYAKAIEILDKSKYRIESRCKVASSCGGCQLLYLDYKKQLEIKKNYVINTINKIGKFDIRKLNELYEDIYHMDVPHRFRNKMQVPFAIKNGEVIYGFYAGRTHHIVNNDYCIVGFAGADIILKTIKDAINAYGISVYDEKTNKGVFREVMLRKGNTTNEVSITYIINDKDYVKNIDLYKSFNKFVKENLKSNREFTDIRHLIIATATININTNHNNVLFGNRNIVIEGPGYIEDSISGINYRISPESFYQINMMMTKVLYDKVIEYADFKGNENVLDLYCGIGTISLYIAGKVKSVTGIEIVEQAIQNAKVNASINNISNVGFICTDTSKLLSDNSISNIYKTDIIIVDPPRKGLDKLTIEFIKKINPRKIIYVSCDPATFARDIDILCHNWNQYIFKKFSNVDMFPHTMHIETVALITHV